MSSSGSGPGRREVAYRLFAAEFDDAELSYSESDEERAPNYVVTPTGARVNRLFAVGVLTEVERVNPEMVRGRVVDPTGAFVTYAGQYQPDELTFLERTEPPAFVALSGKARTFEPEDGDRIFTSVRPEAISAVDAETRDRWIVTTAERTLERIGIVASAIEAELAGDELRAALEAEGVDDRLADGVALALDYYGTTPAYLEALREVALDAVRVVAGERDEAGRLEVAPDEGMGDASGLATIDLAGKPTPETAAAAAGVGSSEPTSGSETESGSAVAESELESEPESDESTTEDAVEADSVAESEPEPETEPESEPDPAERTVSTDPNTDTDPEPQPGSEIAEPAESIETDDEIRSFESDPEEFDPEEFDLDEETREEVEAEFGTEFSTADEVAEPGESDLDAPTPDPDSASEPESGTEPDSEPESEPEPEVDDESEPDPGDDSDDSEDEPVDLEDAVVETLAALDDGDGVPREELVAAVVDEHGVASAEIEDAIQGALMSGQCYEPSDGVYKPI